MKFTVVIACRNEVATLGACLDALEEQDHPDFEVLVVDGNSDDGSAELVRRRGIRILQDPGAGPAAARNVGIAAASGEVVAFTDGDCVPRFDWLSTLATHFQEPTVAGVSGGMRLPRETLLGRLEDNDARIHYRGFITSNVSYRRQVLLDVGGFDGSLKCAEDYDLAWRIMDRGYRIVHEPKAIVLHAPPELGDGLSTYLRKQFWYARHDVPTHAQAILRAWQATGPARGSGAAAKGFVDALGSSALVAGVALGALARSPGIAGTALATAATLCTRKVTTTLRAIGEGREERGRMVAVETAKRLARGIGTLVGLAEFSSPSAWRKLRRPAPIASGPGPRAPPLSSS